MKRLIFTADDFGLSSGVNRAVEAAWPELIIKLLPALAATSRRCPCPRLMERYRLRGDINDDWRTWVR